MWILPIIASSPRQNWPFGGFSETLRKIPKVIFDPSGYRLDCPPPPWPGRQAVYGQQGWSPFPPSNNAQGRGVANRKGGGGFSGPKDNLILMVIGQPYPTMHLISVRVYSKLVSKMDAMDNPWKSISSIQYRSCILRLYTVHKFLTSFLLFIVIFWRSFNLGTPLNTNIEPFYKSRFSGRHYP